MALVVHLLKERALAMALPAGYHLVELITYQSCLQMAYCQGDLLLFIQDHLFRQTAAWF